MASLLDIIKGNNNALAGTQAGITDETAKAQGLLRAKSGKAVGGEAVSNVGEQAAVDQTNAQLQAQAPQIAAQGQSMDIAARRQQLDTQQQQANITQAKKFDTAENKLKTQQIMSGLARDKGSLDLDKDKSRLEQASFLLSMQDKSYVDQLQDAGRRQRLDNDVNFKAAQEQLAFGRSLGLLKSKLGNADILAMSDQDYKKAMSDLSVDQAMQIAQMEIQDAQNSATTQADLEKYKVGQNVALSGIQSKVQGLQGLVQAGTQAYNTYANTPSATETPLSRVTDTTVPTTGGIA